MLPFGRAARLSRCEVPGSKRMCDTLAIRRKGAVWFAKNSDREPGEVQRVEYHPKVADDPATRLRCTYIEIDQIPDRQGLLISRPQWMWGAEMGVNDAGVVIGNEAVFSNSVLKRGEALLGMDLVRLGLERASTAFAAVETITGLLERYGQGGGAGFRDRNFRYDNSFLIADTDAVFVLETAGRDWAVKEAEDGWAISNSYTLRADHYRATKAGDFKASHEAFAMPRLACASARRMTTMEKVANAPPEMSLSYLAQSLRKHDAGDGFDRGSNRDICMHAAGPLRPHASTGSMIAVLRANAPPIAAFTGTLHPCISLFKPAGFDAQGRTIFDPDLFAQGARLAARAKRDRAFRKTLRQSIAAAEPALFEAIAAGAADKAEALAASWTREWLQAQDQQCRRLP